MAQLSATQRTVVAMAAVTVLSSLVAAAPADATPSSCAPVSVARLNATLGIDAAHVNAVHPAAPVGALICSYFGNAGRSANEATINYVAATPVAFANVKAALARSHRIRTIGGIKAGAYSYDIGSERYLYVLDGAVQVQIFATVPLVRLEALARALPGLS